MTATLEDLQNEIKAHKDYRDLIQSEWEAKIEMRKLHRRSANDLTAFQKSYVQILNTLRGKLRGDWTVTLAVHDNKGNLRTGDAILMDMMEDINHYTEKEIRILDKLACVCKEDELRKEGLVTRTNVHDDTDYYVDYTNGIDTALGEKQGNFTADAGTNTTTIVDSELDGKTITDNAASSGDWVWNVTRGEGSYVDSWDDGTDTITLTGSITGQTTGDTYYIISAWKTIAKATETTSLAAGDRVFLRDGISWLQGTLADDVNFDDNGSVDKWISLIGCDDGDYDEWGNGGSTKAKIDFEDASYQAIPDTDYWRVENIEWTQSGDSYTWVLNGHFYVKNCDFTDNPIASAGHVYHQSNDVIVTFDQCTFEDGGNDYLILAYGRDLILKECTFTAGTGSGTDYGIRGSLYCSIWMCDCTFSGSFTNEDIWIADNGYIYARNTTWSGSGIRLSDNGILYSEDDNGTFEAQKKETVQGTIERMTATPFSGGADSYVRMTPDSSNCGRVKMLRLGGVLRGFARVWVASGSEKTITIKARGSDWSTEPGNSGDEETFYIEAAYLDSGSDSGRTYIKSAQDLSGTSEVSFTVTFTPQKTGWVYLWAYLGTYEANEYVEVDIKPVVT